MRKVPNPSINELVINDIEIRKAKLLFRAINHKLRQQLLQFIHKEKQSPVTPIYEALRLEQSVASHHLAILRRAGFVSTKREGKHIYYSVNYKRIDEIQSMVIKFLNA
jgi:DNA-binding transcriptional ArsR family regulator